MSDSNGRVSPGTGRGHVVLHGIQVEAWDLADNSGTQPVTLEAYTVTTGEGAVPVPAGTRITWASMTRAAWLGRPGTSCGRLARRCPRRSSAGTDLPCTWSC